MIDKEIRLLLASSVLVLIVASLLLKFSNSSFFDYICAKTQSQANATGNSAPFPLKTVAKYSLVGSGKVAILASGPTLSANMAGENAEPLYLIIATVKGVTFTAVRLNKAGNLLRVLQAQRAQGVITYNLSPQSAELLMANGVAVYTGIFGHVQDVMALYQSGQLLAMR